LEAGRRSPPFYGIRIKIFQDRLNLEIPEPLVDHAYYFNWDPPSVDQDPQLARLHIFESGEGS